MEVNYGNDKETNRTNLKQFSKRSLFYYQLFLSDIILIYVRKMVVSIIVSWLFFS